MKSRKLLFITLALAGFILTSHALPPPTISITQPTAATTVSEGDDFATKVIGEQWNMNQLRDIPFEVGYEQPVILTPENIWISETLAPNAYVFPLFRGYSTPGYTNYFSVYDKGIPYGPINPITADVYSSLSFRSAANEADRSNVSVFWTKHPNYSEFEQGNQIAFADGPKAHTVQLREKDGYRIYDIDLTATGFFRERIQPGPTTMFDEPYTAGTWDRTVYSFLINMSDAAPVGSSQSIDWIRLYNPETSPELQITWQTTDVPVGDNYSVSLFVDTKNSGYDGDLLVSGIVNDGSYTLRTAALPPGTYYFYLKVMERGLTAFHVIATSQYSGPLVINASPTLKFSAPSYTSGADYATSELGQPWDMSSPSVLETTFHVSDISFNNGILSALADPPAPGQTESDAQIWFNTKLHGKTVPINTSKYRYLTVKTQVDTDGYTNIYDRIFRGWVARAAWATDDWQLNGTMTKDIPILEGWHSYTLDLWDINLYENKNLVPAQSQRGWTDIDSVSVFRWDPLEVPQSTRFRIDDVKLCAENMPANNQYTIAWNAEDPDSVEITVTLYYGAFNEAGDYNEAPTPIATLVQKPGSNSVVWNTANLGEGEYFIRALVSDGINTFTTLSDVPVVIPDKGKFPPYVYDGLSGNIDVTTGTTLSCNWGNFYNSNLTHYKVAIGHTSNATDVLSWTSTSNTTFTWSGKMEPGKTYFCSVQGVGLDGTTVISPVCSDGVTCVGNELTTVYRLYSVGAPESTGEHLFTTSRTEHDVLDSWPSWVSEGIGWYSFGNAAGFAVPLYRLYCPSWRQHHYTINKFEYEYLASDTATWNAEGIQYYVFSEQVPGAQPAYRFYQASTQAHHFTIDTNEVHAIISNPQWGYVAEGIAYYVFSSDKDQ
ncbi:MAG: hypothetical protein GX811_00565 [Lentisphaerae bacterium]|nr:hypothetical protein [Lentisphaerota bacterium]